MNKRVTLLQAASAAAHAEESALLAAKKAAEANTCAARAAAVSAAQSYNLVSHFSPKNLHPESYLFIRWNQDREACCSLLIKMVQSACTSENFSQALMRLKRILYSAIIVLSKVGREFEAARKSDMAPMPNLTWFQ